MAVTAYRVDAALPGRVCEAVAHGDAPVAAVVRTIDNGQWCGAHWWPLADQLKRDAVAIDYSPSAWARLRLRE